MLCCLLPVCAQPRHGHVDHIIPSGSDRRPTSIRSHSGFISCLGLCLLNYIVGAGGTSLGKGRPAKSTHCTAVHRRRNAGGLAAAAPALAGPLRRLRVGHTGLVLHLGGGGAKRRALARGGDGGSRWARGARGRQRHGHGLAVRRGRLHRRGINGGGRRGRDRAGGGHPHAHPQPHPPGPRHHTHRHRRARLPHLLPVAAPARAAVPHTLHSELWRARLGWGDHSHEPLRALRACNAA
mmetsp:Transcript_17923/g.45584  ORF Transcript_17923/g.45584 Transcript_17923/m.45584 type:complete len:238 (-) Transcript_17923:1069-1782(-)